MPARSFNCHARGLNHYGLCVEPFVLHLAGAVAKDGAEENIRLGLALRNQMRERKKHGEKHMRNR